MKNKNVAGIMAIFFGSLGIHYFYLGDNKKGTKYLLIALLTFGVGAMVLEVLGIIDGVKLLSMSDDEFNAAYNGASSTTIDGSSTSYAPPAGQNVNPNKKQKDKIEALKKYKELLDIGAITQDEFDQLKQEVLSDE